MKAPTIACAVVLGAVAVTLTGCGGTPTTTPAPTTLPPSTQPPTTLPPVADCLCVFDVDRTLTAKQGSAAQCPAAKTQTGVHDDAYQKGTLILSEVGLSLNKSFCSECYHGIVSAGSASGDGSKERAVLLEKMGGKARTMTDKWQDGNTVPVTSSLCLSWPDETKQVAVDSIVKWFKSEHQITIPTSRVHFFDDRTKNIVPFTAFNTAHKTQFNARKISCGSRDSSMADATGECGAHLTEIDAGGEDHGSVVQLCPATQVVV